MGKWGVQFLADGGDVVLLSKTGEGSGGVVCT